MLEYINGITFAPFASRGTFNKEETYKSLDALIERTHANFIILVPHGLQETAQSEDIIYDSEDNISDDELIKMITYIKNKGLRVALKPTANCKNGTWRAHINFFDEDVHCEPKWSNWFKSYTDFQLHYAKIAEETKCEMFIAGCEMVMSERRENEWRQLIKDIKNVYHGLVSYNTDKYQEHNVKWWDCVDVISSSGYYPINDWEKELDRIEKVVKKYNKPFFFAEAGCMSTEGSKLVPNDWMVKYPINDWEKELDRIEKVVKKYNKPFFFAEAGCMSTEGSKLVPNDWMVKGDIDLQGQADWYEAMFKAIEKRPWVGGCALWSWHSDLYSADEAKAHRFYDDLQGQADWYEAMFKAIEKRPWVGGCALWSWHSDLYSADEAKAHRFYEIYEKPAEKVVAAYYKKNK